MAPQPARSLFDLDCAGQRFASGFISLQAASGGNSPIFMTRWIALTGVVLLGLAAVFMTEHRKVDVPPAPSALLYLVADTEQELTRMPVRFTRMSDEEEIGIGNALAAPYESERETKKNADVFEIEKYLTLVGLRLSQHAHRRLPYRFPYVAD